MWIKPDPSIHRSELSQTCHKMNIRFQVARSAAEAKRNGGTYSIRCKFSGIELFANDSPQEVADFLRIGGKHE